ncbi:gliding motility-associated C-terminal domain-containing protein [Marinifilum caeruleilacunae]|uniref:T9SS type B sorting domain-containing protein n=1 Tax=Marinifilum caeruleilacunae TaxID=2499076 RepID=A0ABX1WVU0_9BACT|nr:gliding motility-associated C-terminal domain-containing protein [Marinifilum caeruleilacunae]NOU60020.1 T9SS type B sorting domain-containing protein [Marinifilum caeruleilacunae]
MRLKFYILAFLFFSSLSASFAQGRAGVWYFGENAGLDFNVDPAAPLTDGALDTEEGCATVCNAQGDLLFYTDGITVYNRNHVQMANGGGLDGNVSATQSSIIVQQPGSGVLYYIFTVDAHQNNLRNGLRYSIVDMSMNGGLGQVTTKNVVLFANEVCEKVTAVKHANGSDFWILTHRWDSRNFLAFQLSAAGLSAAVTSTVGIRHNSSRRSAIGYMKTSPGGDKLAVAIYTEDMVELFDFNTANGQVTNPVQITGYVSPYGVEFSPSGELLYVSLYTQGEMYQFDITSNNEATINASAQLIGSGPWYYGALQLAPDNRIYMAKTNNSATAGSLNLDVINDPDVVGVGCNWVADSKNLAGRRCWLGLPNFVTSIFSLEFAYQYNCEGDNTEFTISSDLSNIASAVWDFGDGTSQTSNVSPFSVSHVFPAAGTYDVNLEVNLISGGTDNVTQSVTIRALPTANDQTLAVWEDVIGGGVASGIDLTALEAAVNGGAGVSYTWYSDAALTTLVPDPTNVSASNGQQFWVEVNDGVCTNVAVVTITVNALPQAVDQNPVVCEDNYNTGIASNIDLTLLENAITNGSGSPVTWFHDVGLSNPVSNPNNRVVSDGEVFYAEVSTGTGSSVATVTYTVESLPEGNDITIQLWEDTFGSGTASGVDLTSYDNQVSNGSPVVWYTDASFTNLVTGPGNITVTDGDIFYAFIDNGSCTNRGSVEFIVRSSPIANDQNIDICEDVAGSGTASNIDLTLLDGAINGGISSTVTWYNDAALTNPVPDPTNVVVSDGQQFHVLVEEGGESNTAIVTYTVLPLPTANSQIINEFEDIPGSNTANAVDLTFYNNAITGGQPVNIEWYLDAGLTSLVPDPTSHDVVDGDIFYVLVSNATCSNVATVQFNVLNTPVARDVFPEVCEDVSGSGTAVVDLTLLENQINDGNGDTFNWFFDWPTEPNGLPTNPIASPNNLTVNNGARYFAAVDDGTNTNVAVVTYTVRPLPSALDIVQDVWEDSFGTGLATGINLLNYNSLIDGGSGNSVIWYTDAAFTNAVLTPDNVSAVNNDVFYALVQDAYCQDGGSITFNVRQLPEASDLQITLCEDTQGSTSVAAYDLTQLETAVNNDPGTTKEWFFDAALSLPVPNPSSTTVSNGDAFFVRVSFGVESNVGQVDFTIQPLPVSQDHSVVLCEDNFNTAIRSGVDLRLYEGDITMSPGVSLVWYSDASYSNAVVNPGNIQVTDGDIYYARIWDGNCESFAELDFTITALPQTSTVTENLCEETYGTSVTSGVNLTDYESDLSQDPNVIIQWFADDRLTIPVNNPASQTISNQSSYYALVTNANSCENSARLNFFVNTLPEANNVITELCEDEPGSGIVNNYDLSGLESGISGAGSIISWFEDISLADAVNNPLSQQITNGLTLYTEITDGMCFNYSRADFVVHDRPTFDLGADTTIFYTESKVLAPAIEIRFLPGTYLWQDGVTSSTYTVTEEGLYTLLFTDFNGCRGEDEIMVYVDRYRIFVPNAFTPNGDGLNDTFGPVITGDIAGEEIEMYIYNRWGEMIYEFTDLGVGWNGTYKGKPVNPGVYVWTLIINGKSKQDGSVSLIR